MRAEMRGEPGHKGNRDLEDELKVNVGPSTLGLDLARELALPHLDSGWGGDVVDLTSNPVAVRSAQATPAVGGTRTAAGLPHYWQ